MRILQSLLIGGIVAGFVCAQLPVERFQPYPGAKKDDRAGKQASAPGTQCEVYTTDDTFAKVYAWYKGVYRPYEWPVPPPVLPSGKPVQWAYFIADGANNLGQSRFWIKVQRPYIGTIGDGADFKDIRQVTVIQTVRRN